MTPETDKPARAATTGTILNLILSRCDWEAPSPLLPAGRLVRRYMLAVLIACLPCVVLATYYLGWGVPAVIGAAFVGAAATECAFAVLRKRPITGGSLALAVLLGLMIPPTMPLTFVAMAAAFGTVFAKEIFGGLGRQIFCPVLVAKAFLALSFPALVAGSSFASMLGYGGGQLQPWLTCTLVTLGGAAAVIIAEPRNLHVLVPLAGGAVGLALGLESSGQLAGFTAAVGDTSVTLDTGWRLLAADAFVFCACFVVCDPSTGPRHTVARWVYGLLIGLLAVAMRRYASYGEAMMFAVLIGNLFAPLLDVAAGVRGQEETPDE